LVRFGRIDYLNLLPFHIFLKRYYGHSQLQMMLRHGANVPSMVNRAFATRRIDAAFISSIRAKGRQRQGLGIVAEGAVQSVLLIPGQSTQSDPASETSNVLAAILGLQGRVLIGDPALRAYLQGIEAVDLATQWQQRFGLPFVFAVLCRHGRAEEMRRLERAFGGHNKKIPQYLLHRAAQQRQIAPEAVSAYLTHICYTLDHRALRALGLFWRLSKCR